MYRYKLTKNQCLINALVWTGVFALYALVALLAWPGAHFGGRLIMGACLPIMAISIGVHWYRWLAYDQK